LKCFLVYSQQRSQKPPRCASLQRAGAAAAGLHPDPADVQPGQLGTVLKELLDGDVTHVELGRQRVFFLHGIRQLLEYL